MKKFNMSENILINWFEEKINNCYHIIKDDGDIIWVYDKNYIRKKKLAEIIDKKLNLPTTYKNENILFYQDQKNMWFDCDLKVWNFFEKNYSIDYGDIQSFIKNILKNIELLKNFSPVTPIIWLRQDLKMFNPREIDLVESIFYDFKINI